MTDKSVAPINEKLMQIQGKLKVPKGQFNKFGGFSYRSCEDIFEGVKPFLSETNCVLMLDDEVVVIGDRYYVKSSAILTDVDSGGWVTSTAYAREEENKKGMDGAQITGSASSYARKYALNGLFCLDDVKDPDTGQNEVTQSKGKPPQTVTVEGEVESVKEENPKSKLTREIFAIGKDLGQTEEEIKEYILTSSKKKDPSKLTLQDLHKALEYYTKLAVDEKNVDGDDGVDHEDDYEQAVIREKEAG